jgi:hypothetical protein
MLKAQPPPAGVAEEGVADREVRELHHHSNRTLLNSPRK